MYPSSFPCGDFTLSDVTFQINDSYAPTEKLAPEQTFASQSLQVGINQFKELTGGTGAKIETVGFASNEQLLADLTASENINDSQHDPAPTNQELLDQFHKDYAKDTSPAKLQELGESSFKGMSTAEIKEFFDKRVQGQEEYLSALTPKQLQVVGNMAAAIKRNDPEKLAAILKDTPPLVTRHLTTALQYALQTTGTFVQVDDAIENNRAYLTLKDYKKDTVTKIDMQTGVSFGPQPFDEIPTK